MRIHSNFQDFYDFVATQYGGGDPRVVYLRGRLSPKKIIRDSGGSYETFREVEMESCPLTPPNYHAWGDSEIIWMYLVIAGKAYLMLRKRGDSLHLDDLSTYRIEWSGMLSRDESKYGWWRRKGFGVELGKEHPFLIALSRRLEAPVFAIQSITYPWHSRKATLRIPGQCPILKDLGVPAHISAFQMYQDLAYFVGNTMKVHPDTHPPVEVGNRGKILKAGFDLRQSFRHRQ